MEEFECVQKEITEILSYWCKKLRQHAAKTTISSVRDETKY